MDKVLLVGLGGFIGSVFRYSLGGLVHQVFKNPYPYGTFTVNILGCLLIGFLAGLGEGKIYMSPRLRVFLLMGILGGFTTFSSFGYETFGLLSDGQSLAAFVNIAATLVLGLLAVFVGNLLAGLV